MEIKYKSTCDSDTPFVAKARALQNKYREAHQKDNDDSWACRPGPEVLTQTADMPEKYLSIFQEFRKRYLEGLSSVDEVEEFQKAVKPKEKTPYICTA